MAEHGEPQVKRQKIEMDPIFREFHDNVALLNELKHDVRIIRNGYNLMNLALQSILETNACSVVSFSKATVTIKTIKDAGTKGNFVAGSIFCDGIHMLEQYIDAKKVPKEYLRRNVLAKLLKFLSKEGRLCGKVVRVFSDVLVAFLYLDICHYRQSNLAIENPEFSQPVVAGHFQ